MNRNNLCSDNTWGNIREAVMHTSRRAKATIVALGMFLANLRLFSQHNFAADFAQIKISASVS